MDRSCSQIRICRSDVNALQAKLRREYFSKWDENFVVDEYRGFSRARFSELLDKVNTKFKVTGENIRPKMEAALYAGDFSYKIYKIGHTVDSGTNYFGLVALGKEKIAGKESFNAITFLYKLDIAVAKIRYDTRTSHYALGFIPVGDEEHTRWETKSLDFATKQSLTNFCRIKAFDAFCRQGLASYGVNDVPSIEDIE